MAKPHRTPPPDPAPEDLDVDLARLSPEEIAFLLGGAPEDGTRERLLRAERNARANARRTARRAADADYAERLRAGDRDRQRRRRAAGAAEPRGAPSSEAPVPLPAIAPDEAARRLTEHLRESDTAQARQLRARPELVRRYVAGFAAYRLLSVAGARPTRGALAEALRDRFGLELTPSQVQKLRDHVEGFARPGGPWHAG